MISYIFIQYAICNANNFFRIFWNRNCLDDLDLNDALENVRNNKLSKFHVNLSSALR